MLLYHMPKNITVIMLAVIAYGISTGVAYWYFKQNPSVGLPFGTKQIISQPLPSPAVGKNGVAFDTSLPKTEPCPLNGAKYSAQQRQWWEKHEPLGVMIENHTD